jgi:hypothetical protein
MLSIASDKLDRPRSLPRSLSSTDKADQQEVAKLPKGLIIALIETRLLI